MDLENLRRKAKWEYRFYFGLRLLHFCSHGVLVFYSGKWSSETGESGYLVVNCIILAALLFSLLSILTRDSRIDEIYREFIIFGISLGLYFIIFISKMREDHDPSNEDQEDALPNNTSNSSSLPKALIPLITSINKTNKYTDTVNDIDENESLTNITTDPFKNSSDVDGRSEGDDANDLLSVSSLENQLNRISEEFYMHFVIPSSVTVATQFLVVCLSNRYKKAAKALREAEQQDRQNVQFVPVHHVNHR